VQRDARGSLILPGDVRLRPSLAARTGGVSRRPHRAAEVSPCLAATPTPPTPKEKEEQMPWRTWINDPPTEFFLVVHITAFSKDMDGEVIVK
jgi:hypothetical protein